MKTQETDVIVVGLGAAGGIAVKVLSEASVNVIGVEAGPWRGHLDYAPDELSSWKFRNTVGTKFNRERPTHRPDAFTPTTTASASLGLMMNGVGGSSIHYGAWSRRFEPGDFTSYSDTVARYGIDAFPNDCTLADWPINYDELEPYYDRVEKAIGISGVAGRVKGKPLNPEGNPFEGERSDEYPLPPLRKYEGGELFRKGASEMGYHPFPSPAAVISQDYKGRAGFSYANDVVDLIGRDGSKSSTLLTSIPEAVETGKLEIKALTRVTQLLVQDGKVVGVDIVDASGVASRLLAPRVLVATYTFEAVRLLFLSATKGHESGLGNNTGQLGKHFMTRNFIEVAGLFPEKPFNRLNGITAQAVAIEDLHGDNFDHTGLGFIRGGTIGTENGIQPIGASKMIPPQVPRWGSEYKKNLREVWNMITFLRGQPEPLPYVGNELDLDPRAVESGPLALPKIRITYSVRENERKQTEYLLARMEEILARMGATQTWRGRTETGILSCHDVGGARMGLDPTTSVTDSYGQLHEVAGLYVLGGATFPTCPGINTTETIQALAWRTAESIAQDLAAKAAASFTGSRA